MLRNTTVMYFSTATSTFILRVSRDHYRIPWAALSLMNTVPVKNGKSCVFRVVRVSGSIRIRRAREMILKAQHEAEEKGESTLDSMFGKGGAKEVTKDTVMADRSDTEEEDEDCS
jgi:ribonuclease P/MRP protein subunit POP5